MEDAATAEISRAQLWQWIHHDAKLDDGSEVTPELYERLRERIVELMGEGFAVELFARPLPRVGRLGRPGAGRERPVPGGPVTTREGS
jgi:hypothetical protein